MLTTVLCVWFEHGRYVAWAVVGEEGGGRERSDWLAITSRDNSEVLRARGLEAAPVALAVSRTRGTALVQDGQGVAVVFDLEE